LENNNIKNANKSLSELKKLNVPEYNDYIFKERSLARLEKFLNNDEAQPYLKEFFDMTYKEGCGWWSGHLTNLIQ